MYKLKCVSVRERLGNGRRLPPTPFSTCRQTEAPETPTAPRTTNGRNKEAKNKDVSRNQTDTWLPFAIYQLSNVAEPERYCLWSSIDSLCIVYINLSFTVFFFCKAGNIINKQNKNRGSVQFITLMEDKKFPPWFQQKAVAESRVRLGSAVRHRCRQRLESTWSPESRAPCSQEEEVSAVRLTSSGRPAAHGATILRLEFSSQAK